ncbi:hypothetical protein [Flagellimonas sp.]|uniref:hypothetical protein n=1 Tax=Flagellimonas sp. TaxID=2058762 RepID=UPI003B507BFE
MKKAILIVFASLPFICGAQKKIKTIKSPVGWYYQIAPEAPLADNLKNYQIKVKTDLDPMDFWDEVNWSIQVNEKDPLKRRAKYESDVQDTINKWADNYLALKDMSYTRSNPPDFTITLHTDQFTMENVQTDIDYSDQESLLGEINVSANLKVETSKKEVLLDIDIPYYIDDENGQTKSLRLKHFAVNPSFKLKLKMTKKPEKREKLLKKRIKRFEADILEYFMQEAGKILRSKYLSQQERVISCLFGIKSKEYDALNTVGENTETAINSLSALSKKKRKTLEEITPDLHNARDFYTEALTKATDPDVQDILNLNLATMLLLLNDVDAAKFQIQNIPELQELGTKTIWEGSFTFYLQVLDQAIALKQKYKDRATIHEF